MIPALILAAGRSSRMGRAKALLPCGPDGESFVATLAAALARGGVPEIVVIGRPGDHALQAEVARVRTAIPCVQYIENPDADAGQLSSLLAGLEAIDRTGVRGFLMIPVDVPLVSSRTVAALLAAFDETSGPIVRPVHRGRHGHPVIFARALFDELRRADPSIGARAVVRGHAAAGVDVDDPGVLMDVDTPEDYERMFGA
jgi:molybdenum cofactor cytidylyltransferase